MKTLTFSSKNLHPIFHAILNKKAADVEKMIKKTSDVNARAPDGGKTPLHVAAHRGDLAMVQMLLKNNADVSAVTDAGFTPLHVAAQNDYAEIIDCLVKAGADVNATTKVGCTPLHESAANGFRKSSMKLIKLKANLEAKDFRYNLTPSNLAYQKGHTQLGDDLSSLMTSKACFIQNVNLILFNWSVVFPSHSTEDQFIQQLHTKIKNLKEADQILEELNATLKSEVFAKLLINLKDFKDSLVKSIKKYKKAKTTKPQHPTEIQNSSDIITYDTDKIIPLLEAYKLSTQANSNPADLIYDYYQSTKITPS